MTELNRERFVADTQALFWFLIDPARLGRGADAALRLVEAGLADLCLPTIVLAELVHLARKQRVAIPLDDLLSDERLGSVVEIAALDLPVLREFERLDTPTEIHDRLIVATARVLRAPLITSDAEIQSGGQVETVW